MSAIYFELGGIISFFFRSLSSSISFFSCFWPMIFKSASQSHPSIFIAFAILSNFGALRRIPSFKTRHAPPLILFVSIRGKSLKAETSSVSVASPLISTGNHFTANLISWLDEGYCK